jgi:hypothetical protein
MKALWQIILAILWRLRPVQALEVNLRDIIEIGLHLFGDDLSVEELASDPAYRAATAAALADAHRKLDLLIYLRACELTGTRHDIQGFQPNYAHIRGSTDLDTLWSNFRRLVAKFDDYERLAEKRAERLKREKDSYPDRLAAALQSICPALCAAQATRRRLAIPSTTHREDGLARPTAPKAAGGAASSRGPPHLPIPDFAVPRLGSPASGIAPSCPAPARDG